MIIFSPHFPRFSLSVTFHCTCTSPPYPPWDPWTAFESRIQDCLQREVKKTFNGGTGYKCEFLQDCIRKIQINLMGLPLTKSLLKPHGLVSPSVTEQHNEISISCKSKNQPDAGHIHRYPTGSYKKAHPNLNETWSALFNLLYCHLQGPHIQWQKDQEGADKQEEDWNTQRYPGNYCLECFVIVLGSTNFSFYKTWLALEDQV